MHSLELHVRILHVAFLVVGEPQVHAHGCLVRRRGQRACVFCNGRVKLACRRKSRTQVRARFGKGRLYRQRLPVVIYCAAEISMLLRSDSLAQIIVRF